MFDPIKWSDIVKLAIDGRTLGEYSLLSGVSKASLSNFINCTMVNPPKYETVEKISNATPEISLERFLECAGLSVGSQATINNLTRSIENLLIDKGIIVPNQSLEHEQVDQITNFIRKCIDFHDSISGTFKSNR